MLTFYFQIILLKNDESGQFLENVEILVEGNTIDFLRCNPSYKHIESFNERKAN